MTIPAATPVIKQSSVKAGEIGDGNFSYTFALLRKHKDKRQLPNAIISSELETRLSHSILDRIKLIKGLGACVLLGINATKLHTNFKGRRFRRIHFNCPHGGGDYYTGSTSRLVSEFFQSARHLQKKGDRIHLTLAQPRGQEAWRQEVAYGVVSASKKAHYALIRERKFGMDRYPKYEHKVNFGNGSAKAVSKLVEFIFEKRNLIDDFTVEEIRPTLFGRYAHFPIDPGYESSDYYSSDDEES